MFLHVSVIHSVHSGEYLTRYTPHSRHPPDQVPPWPGTPPGTRYTPPGPGTLPQTSYIPLGQGTLPQDQVHHPPGPGTPPPPGSRYTPQTRYTPGPGTPPQDQVHPPDHVHPPPARSTCGRSASYWNAILVCSLFVLCVCLCLVLSGWKGKSLGFLWGLHINSFNSNLLIFFFKSTLW